jgi:hypothetical protein
MAASSTTKPSKKATPVSSRANGSTKPGVAAGATPEKPAVTARAAKTVKAAKPKAVSPKVAPPKAAKPKAPPAKAPRSKPAKAVEAKSASTAAEQKAKRAKKEKVVRDSFTMPKSDYEKLAALKQKCLESGIAVKKSELLRAGLLLLEGVSVAQLLDAIAAVETVKTGRPAKSSQQDAAQ